MTYKDVVFFPILASIFFLEVFLWHFNLYTPSIGDALFVFLFVCALGYYRPGWVFVTAIGLLPLEMISLVPESYGATVRPSLLCAGASFCGYLIHFFRSVHSGSIFDVVRRHFSYVDIAVGCIFVGGLIGAATSLEQGGLLWKYILILFSFVMIYISARVALMQMHIQQMSLGAFFVGGVLTACYAILQNIFYIGGKTHREVMLGRPNATFAESDWLGIYLIIPIVITSLFIVVPPIWMKTAYARWRIASVMSMIILYSALLLTVARSAWVGMLVAIFVTAVLLWCVHSVQKSIIYIGVHIASIAIALLCVQAFHLSPFELDERASSTVGMQEITISCDEKSRVLPSQIMHVNQLAGYGCQHIDLEDIVSEETAGRYISTIERPDPSIGVRKDIYAASTKVIKEHFFLGIGWGRSGEFLGVDDNGHSHNSANIIFQIMLGSGILGLVGVALVIWTLISSWRIILSREVALTQSQKTWCVTIVACICGVGIANMANAGLLQGYMWVLLAALAVITSRKTMI